MAARFKFRIGDSPDKSYVEVWANGQVVPPDARNLDLPHRYGRPGFETKFFDNGLNPVLLNVKAGTTGTIEIQVIVDYYFQEYDYADMSWLPAPFPIPKKRSPFPLPKEGTVSCGCTWEYSVTKQGELSIGPYVSNDSQVSDRFEVKITSAQSQAKPTSGNPYVMITPRAVFTDDGKPVAMQLKGIRVDLNVTDKYVPPRPPTPIPTYPPALMTIIPFAKEDQRILDDAAKRIASDWVEWMFKAYPQLRDPMMHGKIPVSISGYASKTGPRGEKDEQKINDYDRDIGWGRASNVAKYLNPLLGNKADLAYVTVGRKYAQWAQVYDEKLKKTVEIVGKPRDIDRIVVVWLDYNTVLEILNPKK